jgi:hypothetical protein
MKLRDVLVVDVPALKPDADTKAFETQAIRQAGPSGSLFRADRGNRKGQYLLVHPATGAFRPDLAAFVNGPGQQVEYRLVSPSTAGPLPDVEILGIHYIKVRPDRSEAFDRFVAEKLHPAVANLRPDLRLLYYKAVQGAEAGTYITIFALSSASRDKYWPKGADSDDVRAAFKPVQPLTDELRTYLVEGSYATGANMAAAVYESREWTDFVWVPPVR